MEWGKAALRSQLAILESGLDRYSICCDKSQPFRGTLEFLKCIVSIDWFNQGGASGALSAAGIQPVVVDLLPV